MTPQDYDWVLNGEYCIYMAENKVNGKRYVGQTNDFTRRWRQHCYSKSVFGYALRKYGVNNFEWQILCDGLTKEQADQLENGFVISIGTYNDQDGYNKTFGGGHMPLTPESRKKMADRKRGVKQTEEQKRKIAEGYKKWRAEMSAMPEEHRRKLSEARREKGISEETRRKMSEAHKGQKPSEEVRRKLSEAKKGRKLPEKVKQKISETLKRRKHENPWQQN